MIAVAPGGLDYEGIFGSTDTLVAHGGPSGRSEFDNFPHMSSMEEAESIKALRAAADHPVCDTPQLHGSSIMPAAATAVLSAGRGLDVSPTQATLDLGCTGRNVMGSAAVTALQSIVGAKFRRAPDNHVFHFGRDARQSNEIALMPARLTQSSLGLLAVNVVEDSRASSCR